MRRCVLNALAIWLATCGLGYAASTQIVLTAHNGAPSTSATVYCPLSSRASACSTTEANNTAHIPIAGTLQNFRVDVATAPGLAASGKKFVYTIRLAGASSALTCQILETATSCTDYVTAPVTVVADYAATVESVPTGTPTSSGNIKFTVEFTATTPGQSWSASHGGTNALSPPSFNGVFGFDQAWTAACADAATPTAVAGNLKGTWVTLTAAPGGVKSFTFNVYKNGTIQDGTAGSVNTTLTITGAATTGSVAYTLPLAATDTVCTGVTSSGSPLGRAEVSYRYDATITAQWNVCGWVSTIPTNAQDMALSVASSTGLSWANQPAAFLLHNTVPSSGLSLGLLRLLEASADATNTHTFTVRKTDADTTLTGTIAAAATTGSDSTHSVSFVNGDTVSMGHTRGGATNAGVSSWCVAGVVGATFITTNASFPALAVAP